MAEIRKLPLHQRTNEQAITVAAFCEHLSTLPQDAKVFFWDQYGEDSGKHVYLRSIYGAQVFADGMVELLVEARNPEEEIV